MDAMAFDKSKLPIRHEIEDPSRAPRRFHPTAMGLSEEIHRLFVGVGPKRKDPCTSAPMQQAQSANWGVAAADGMPRRFCTALADAKRTLENVKPDWDQEVVCGIAHPISAAGEVVGLQGSRVPEGALVKVAGMTRLQFCCPARVVDRSRAVKGAGGPIGRVRGGELTALDVELDVELNVELNVEQGTLDIEVSQAGLARGRKPWKTPGKPYRSGIVQKYTDQVGSARASAHAGSRAEVVGYADI